MGSVWSATGARYQGCGHPRGRRRSVRVGRSPVQIWAPRTRYRRVPGRVRGTKSAQTRNESSVYRRGMNVVNLIGNLATDVELKDVGQEKHVAGFLLAVDRPSKDGGADFVHISVWDRQGELCSRYLARRGSGRPRRPPAQPLLDAEDGSRRSAGRGRRASRGVPPPPEGGAARAEDIPSRRCGGLDGLGTRHRLRRNGAPGRDPRLRRRAARRGVRIPTTGRWVCRWSGREEVTHARVRGLGVAGALRAHGYCRGPDGHRSPRALLGP